MAYPLLDHLVPVNLVESIERHIAQRTWRQVQHLTVTHTGDRVVVCGLAPSYYIKQLAILGCMEALPPSEPTHLEVDIDVVGGGKSAAWTRRPFVP